MLIGSALLHVPVLQPLLKVRLLDPEPHECAPQLFVWHHRLTNVAKETTHHDALRPVDKVIASEAVSAYTRLVDQVVKVALATSMMTFAEGKQKRRIHTDDAESSSADVGASAAFQRELATQLKQLYDTCKAQFRLGIKVIKKAPSKAASKAASKASAPAPAAAARKPVGRPSKAKGAAPAAASASGVPGWRKSSRKLQPKPPQPKPPKPQPKPLEPQPEPPESQSQPPESQSQPPESQSQP
eukprot:7380315-Prymnesium_polylepis.1